MTPLRQKMIDTMVLKGFSARTQSTYLYAIEKLAKHFRRSPATLSSAEIESYFVLLLQDKQLSAASVRLMAQATLFLFRQVLQQEIEDFAIRYPKKPQRIPALLTRDEVQSILTHAHNGKYHALLATNYAAGLRVSETVALRIGDIEGKRGVMTIRQGKGNKDRVVLLTPALLQCLRHYWQQYRPYDYLFYGRDMREPLSIISAQRAFTRAKAAAGIRKPGGIHSLRHAYATHQLDAGMPVHRLQRLLGHTDLKSTMRYVHWLPDYQSRATTGVDLLAHAG